MQLRQKVGAGDASDRTARRQWPPMNPAAFPISASRASTVADEVLDEALRDCARHRVPALRRIHDLTAAGMLGLLVQMLGDRGEAEALLQQGYIAVWQQAASFNPGRSRPHTWLRSVFRQQAIDHLRARQYTPADEVDAGLRLADAALGEQDQPPPGLRLLRLAFLTGRSPHEIARALGKSAAEVRTGIREALLAMQEPAVNLQGRALAYVAGAYALGTLSSRARRRFETLLQSDLAARRCLQQWDERLAGLAPSLPPVRPPDAAWAQIAARIAPARRSTLLSPQRWALLAALVLLALVVVLIRNRR